MVETLQRKPDHPRDNKKHQQERASGTPWWWAAILRRLFVAAGHHARFRATTFAPLTPWLAICTT